MCRKCDALPKKICDTFVSGIHSRYCFWEFQASTPYQKLQVPESRSTLLQLCIMVASCPSLRCSCRKKTISYREAEGLVTELSSQEVFQYTATQAFSLCELELGLPALQLLLLAKCDALRRLVGHLCSRNPFPPFLFEIRSPSTQSLPEAGSERDSMFHSSALCLQKIPSLRCSCRKRPVSCREAEGLVTELLSPRLVTILWLCSQLCYYVTAANQRAIVEIELLATVGWKWGCQPFSCPCSQMWCTSEKRSMLRNPNSRHSFWEFLRAAVRSTSSALCFYYACNRFFAFVEDSGFVSHAEKQRVWSQFCYCDCCNANQRTLVEIELLATVGLKWGCQPFSCPWSENVRHCRKEISATCLFQESIPAIAFGNSKHPLPTRSFRFLRAGVPSCSCALWLHHAHPFVAAAEKKQSHIEKQKVWSRSCRLRKCFNILQPKLLASVSWNWGCQPCSCCCWQNVMH